MNIEEIMKKHADPSCPKCYGTGRTGFYRGDPEPCKCALKRSKAAAAEHTEQERAAQEQKRALVRARRAALKGDLFLEGEPMRIYEGKIVSGRPVTWKRHDGGTEEQITSKCIVTVWDEITNETTLLKRDGVPDAPDKFAWGKGNMIGSALLSASLLIDATGCWCYTAFYRHNAILSLEDTWTLDNEVVEQAVRKMREKHGHEIGCHVKEKA